MISGLTKAVSATVSSSPKRLNDNDPTIGRYYTNNFFPYKGNFTSYLPKSGQDMVKGEGISTIHYNNLISSDSIQKCLEKVNIRNFADSNKRPAPHDNKGLSHENIIEFLKNNSKQIMSKFLETNNPDIKLLDKEKEYLLISKSQKSYLNTTQPDMPYSFVLAKINEEQEKTINIYCHPLDYINDEDGKKVSSMSEEFIIIVGKNKDKSKNKYLTVTKHVIDTKNILIVDEPKKNSKIINNNEFIFNEFIFFIKNDKPEVRIADEDNSKSENYSDKNVPATINRSMYYQIKISLIDGLSFKDIGNSQIIDFLNTKKYEVNKNRFVTYYKHFLYEPDYDCINDIKKNVYNIGGGKRTNKTSKKHRKQTLKRANKKSRKTSK